MPIDSLAKTSITGPAPGALKVAAQQSVTFSYTGPVPPPALLKQYNDLVPGAAARILAQAEAQTNHRIEMERKVTDSDICRSNWGLAAGFCIAILAIGGGIALVALGHDWAGATIATLATGSLVGVFVYGKSEQRKERSERARTMAAAAKDAATEQR